MKIIMKLKVKKNYIIIDSIFIILTILIVMLDDKIKFLPLVGYILVPMSIYMLIKCRNNRFLSYLIIVIAMINISIGVNDLINLGEGISEWQMARMRMTEYNVMTAKSLLIFNAGLMCFINGELCCEQDNIELIENMRVHQTGISIICLVALVGILVYGFIFEFYLHSDGYSSVSNPIFEYSVLIYVLAWLTCKENQLINVALIIYALIFITMFLHIGDRSSASMYIIFLLITRYKGKINILKLLVAALLGIMVFNMIAIFRTGENLTLTEFLCKMIQRGIYSDTCSWAYYSSITVVAIGKIYNHPIKMMLGFLGSLVGFDSEYTNLQKLAREYDSYLLFNRGGSIFPSYFMAWMGYFGSMFAAVIIGLIIHKLFRRTKGISTYYKFLIIIFVIRWYVYTPLNLFRSVFVIGGLVYLAFLVTTGALKRGKTI
jgi:hypothetical protein